MALPDYRTVARHADITRCRGISTGGQTCYMQHWGDGSYDETGTVHWADRRSGRAGIRRLLHLAAYSSLDGPDWRRYWGAQRLVTQWLRELRIEMPRTVTARYRAELKAMLVNVPTNEPDREEALRWASS